LGLGDLSAAEYVVVTFDFAEGDLLLPYTDGVTEARNPDGVFYPLAARIAGWTKGEPEQLLSLITDDLRAYVAGPLADDAAAIAVRRAQRAEPDGDPPDGR
jgi:serine phosphatase RsbU (regulator of sigma subunit)